MDHHPISRRRILATGLSCATAAWTLGSDQPILLGGQFTGKIQKAVKYHMIQEDLSILDKFKLLAELGFDGVESRTSEMVDRQEMRRASERTGVRIHGVVNSSNPDLVSAIELAAYYGGTSVLVVVPIDRSGSYLANYRERQEIIRRALPVAERQRIKILVENVWASFLIEPLSMARFVDELQSEWVGVYFDIGNNVRWGYPEHWLEVLGPRVVKLDVKEYSRELQNNQGLRAGFNVEIGEGSINWDRVRQELAKLDFRGWATAEVRGGDRQRLADIAARMDRVLDL